MIEAPLKNRLKNLKMIGAFSTNPVLFVVWKPLSFPVIIGPIILKKKNPKTKNNESPILNFNFYGFLVKCWITELKWLDTKK